MINEIDYTNLDPDADYEHQDGMNRFNIESNDFYDELWGEMLGVDIAIQEYCREFKTVSKAINPKQAAGIYYHSSMDAEAAIRPLDRIGEILKMMWGSDNLSKYDINDFQEFRTLIENIDPFSFYVFTDVLYMTELILYYDFDNTEPLRAFEKKVELLKNNTTKN